MNRLTIKLSLTLLLLFISAPLFAAGDGFSVKMELFKVVNCLIFFGGLAYLLRKPVAEFFTGREADIRESLEMAERSAAEAKERLEEIEAKMANLDAEIADIQESARIDLEKEKERMQARAREEAERILTRARTECENLERQALKDLRTYAADRAVSEAETKIRESMTDGERKQLFTTFTDELGART